MPKGPDGGRGYASRAKGTCRPRGTKPSQPAPRRGRHSRYGQAGSTACVDGHEQAGQAIAATVPCCEHASGGSVGGEVGGGRGRGAARSVWLQLVSSELVGLVLGGGPGGHGRHSRRPARRDDARRRFWSAAPGLAMLGPRTPTPKQRSLRRSSISGLKSGASDGCWCQQRTAVCLDVWQLTRQRWIARSTPSPSICAIPSSRLSASTWLTRGARGS